MTYILYNPLANGGRGGESVAQVAEALGEPDARAVDLTAEEPRRFLMGLAPSDRVILCGGDGTVHRLVNDLAGDIPAAPVYVWRFGTGNDFIRDAAGTDGAPMVLLNEHLAGLPGAEIGGERRRFLNGCSIGVDALVCHMLNESRNAPDRAGYAGLAVKAIFRGFRPMPGTVTVDGETRTYDRLWMAVAMNGRYQGGGMKFAPDQDRRGETLCCLVWHGTTPLGTLLRFPFVIPGKHLRFRKYCDVRFGREITVTLEGTAPVQLDGEVIPEAGGFNAWK